MVMFNTAREKHNLSHAISGYNYALPAHLGMSVEALAALMNGRLEVARARFATPPRQDLHARRVFGRKGVG